MVRLLALDVGDRRVGVAVSDESRLIASPLAVIRRTSKAADFARISSLVREQAVAAIVVGLPLNDDGTLGPQARRVKRYAVALETTLRGEGLSIPVEYWDESLSTVQAQESMLVSGRKAKDRRSRVDAVAAAVILQDYLDARRSGVVNTAEEESL